MPGMPSQRRFQLVGTHDQDLGPRGEPPGLPESDEDDEECDEGAQALPQAQERSDGSQQNQEE
jgi:hypothetical protein